MKRLLISAGEASGDLHGAHLIAALRSLLPGAEFFGLGGTQMRAAGCRTVAEARDVAVMGLAEVVTHLPKIYREFHRLLAAVDEAKPDAAILIDFPDFNFRLARKLHERGVPVFYYISPQLWAWRPGRVELVRKYVRKMLVIFPFEEQFYREHGVDAVYTGHPLASITRAECDRPAFARQFGLDPGRPWIALLPGSRRKEVGLNLPAMLQAAEPFRDSHELLLPVANTLDKSWMAAALQQHSPAARVHLCDDANAALTHARAAIVASGTATLQAALLQTPFVMVYRVAPLTYFLGHHLVRVPHYGIVNLILGRRAVPELVQREFTPGGVAAALEPLLADTPARAGQLQAFEELRRKLSLPEGVPAEQRAAQVIVEALRSSV